jgi:hypothetical protein
MFVGSRRVVLYTPYPSSSPPSRIRQVNSPRRSSHHMLASPRPPHREISKTGNSAFSRSAHRGEAASPFRFSLAHPSSYKAGSTNCARKKRLRGASSYFGWREIDMRVRVLEQRTRGIITEWLKDTMSKVWLWGPPEKAGDAASMEVVTTFGLRIGTWSN